MDMWDAYEKKEIHRAFGGGEPEGHRSLEKTKRRWEDSIKIDLKQN